MEVQYEESTDGNSYYNVSLDDTFPSNDTYDEKVLLEELQKKNVKECGAIAWQFVIVGMGNKNLGRVSIGGSEYEVDELCERNDVRFDSRSDERLEPTTLTPKRLARLYRYTIKDKLEKEDCVSFLFKKYSKSQKFKSSIFPCSEYMLEGEEAEELLAVHETMDERLNTRFAERTRMIFQSRGVLTK